MKHIKDNEWLTKAIVNLSDKYEDHLQILTSSRIIGDHLKEIPFLTVTLLPFTDLQRNEFIKKWFNDTDKEIVKKIISHLENNEEINKITRNPLLITTLCVLARNNLTLPHTEIRLYNDRLKLLTGYYDSVKQIQTRIASLPQDLEFLARKIAFYLHENNKRESSIEDLEDTAIIVMENVLNERKSKIALKELINPCNILIPMNEKGEYGFGHLRFQEHLAAIELNSNRSIDIRQLLKSKWWEDTLLLFARMSDDLVWLIKFLRHYIFANQEIKIMVNKMTTVRPKKERETLSKMINSFREEIDEFSIKDFDPNFFRQED